MWFTWIQLKHKPKIDERKKTLILVEELDKYASNREEDKKRQRAVPFLNDHPNSIPFYKFTTLYAKRMRRAAKKTA